MKDYNAEATEAAYQSVIKHLEIIEDELFNRGYMFYDEFEVTDFTARKIPRVLNERYASQENGTFYAFETEVYMMSFCGAIYNSDIISDMSILKRAVEEYYMKKNFIVSR